METKKIEKTCKTERAVFCLMAICAGVMVGIGGVASLIANSLLGTWGRLVGACLFPLGIFAIVSFEMKLFTGMVADIPTLGLKNVWKLPVCFVCNALGVAIVAALAHSTSLGELITAKGNEIISAKLNAENWATKAFCSSILCGVLITISVKSGTYAPKKGLSTSVGVIFPIIVFAFCGFDHSVANMMYFYYLGEISWRVVGYILLTVLGNLIGGVTLPFISLLREHSENK